MVWLQPNINHPIGCLVNCLDVSDTWRQQHWHQHKQQQRQQPCFRYSHIFIPMGLCVIISIIPWDFVIKILSTFCPLELSLPLSSSRSLSWMQTFDILHSLHNFHLVGVTFFFNWVICSATTAKPINTDYFFLQFQQFYRYGMLKYCFSGWFTCSFSSNQPTNIHHSLR